MNIYPKQKESDFYKVVLNTKYTLRVNNAYIDYASENKKGSIYATRYFPNKEAAIEVRNMLGLIKSKHESKKAAIEALKSYPKWQWRQLFVVESEGIFILKQLNYSIDPTKSKIGSYLQEDGQTITRDMKFNLQEERQDALVQGEVLSIDEVKQAIYASAKACGFEQSGKQLGYKVREERPIKETIIHPLVYNIGGIRKEEKEVPLKKYGRKRFVSQCKHQLQDVDFMATVKMASKMKSSDGVRMLKTIYPYLTRRECREYIVREKIRVTK